MIDLATELDRADSLLARAWRSAMERLRQRNPWVEVRARHALLGPSAALIGTEEAAEEVSAEFRRILIAIAILLQRDIRARSPRGFAFDLTHWRTQNLLRTIEATIVQVVRASTVRAVQADLESGVGMGLDQIDQVLRQRLALGGGFGPIAARDQARTIAAASTAARGVQEDRVGLWLGQLATHEALSQVLAQAEEFGALRVGTTALEWIPRDDELVRGSHSAMRGQRRARGQSFRSGLGNLLRYPGDTSSPDRDWRGCRCTLRPVFAA